VNYYRANMFRRKEKTMEEALAGRLPVPVLVIWGQQDKALEEILVDGTEKHVAHGDKGGGEGGLRVVKIPDASHWVQVDAPAEVNDLLCRFARQVRGEGESQGGRKGGRDGRPCL
jgi:pimeloyl-ACP methyl ester carboxylesterase